MKTSIDRDSGRDRSIDIRVHGRPSCAQPLTDELDYDWQERHEDDGQDHEREVLSDDFEITEEVPGGDADRDPGYCPDHVIYNEAPVRHAAYAGDERRKGPDDRHE